MRVYTYWTTYTQRFHHCGESHGMGGVTIVSHEALNYLKVVVVFLTVPEKHFGYTVKKNRIQNCTSHLQGGIMCK